MQVGSEFAQDSFLPGTSAGALPATCSNLMPKTHRTSDLQLSVNFLNPKFSACAERLESKDAAVSNGGSTGLVWDSLNLLSFKKGRDHSSPLELLGLVRVLEMHAHHLVTAVLILEELGIIFQATRRKPFQQHSKRSGERVSSLTQEPPLMHMDCIYHLWLSSPILLYSLAASHHAAMTDKACNKQLAERFSSRVY